MFLYLIHVRLRKTKCEKLVSLEVIELVCITVPLQREFNWQFRLLLPGLVQVLELLGKYWNFENPFHGHLKLLEIEHFSWKIDQTPLNL